jgi:cholesterol transport system auxiliary component
LDLVVERPSASSAIDVDGVLVRPAPAGVAYLPDARWSAPAPAMIQTALVEMLLRSEGFRHVGRQPLRSSADLLLVSDLLDFDASVAEDARSAWVRMTVTARLVSDHGGTIVETRTFTHAVSTADLSTPAILAAFAVVADAVLVDMGRWLLQERRMDLS